MDKKIKIYALSTCIWCKKTIEYFKNKNVKFEHIFVDTQDEAMQEKLFKEIEKVNPKVNFPTILINDTIIVGYDTKKFDEELKK